MDGFQLELVFGFWLEFSDLKRSLVRGKKFWESFLEFSFIIVFSCFCDGVLLLMGFLRV